MISVHQMGEVLGKVSGCSCTQLEIYKIRVNFLDFIKIWLIYAVFSSFACYDFQYFLL